MVSATTITPNISLCHHRKGRSLDGIMNFPKNVLQVILVSPTGKMSLEFANVADPPDMVPDSVVLHVGPVELAATDVLTRFNRLKHGTARVATSSDVVNLAR